MRIVKEGKLPGEQEYRATCRRCGTLFVFLQSEAVLKGDQRDGDYLEVACPLKGCGAAVLVDPSKAKIVYRDSRQ